MKQYLTALALMLTLSATTMSAAPMHRHHNTQAMVAKKDTAKTVTTAYSDTTCASKDTAVAAVKANNAQPATNNGGDEDKSEFWSFMHSFGGVSSVFIATIAIIFAFAFLVAPFVLLIFLLKWLFGYLNKRHKDNIALMEKAVEAGQPLPESVRSVDKQSDEYLWRRGIRNAAIGLGLMIMFGFWGASALVGVGGLILCFGLGQAGTSWYSTHKNEKKNDINDIDELK